MAKKKSQDINLKLSEDTQENLSKVADILNKEFGEGTVFGGKDGQAMPNIEAISTGDYGLDMALGIGGVPRGRIIEIYGPESSGKTTLALSIVREAVKAGGVALYVDAENAFDAVYAENMGIGLDNLLISQPESGEQALMITEKALRTRAVDVIVIDSVAALTPKAELEGSMEDQQMGAQARMLSKGLRKITSLINQTNTLVIFINQIREKIGVMFGNPETTPGGRSLKFYSSVRMEIRRKDSITDPVTGDPCGIISNVKIVKNKVAPPFKKTEISMVANQHGEWGVSHIGSILTMAEEIGLLEKSGSWYAAAFDESIRFQGKEPMKAEIASNTELRKTLEEKIEKYIAEELDKIRKPIEKVVEQAALTEEDFYDDDEDDFEPVDDTGDKSDEETSE